jgi:mono/diheme cytochrome c family protein
VYLIQLDGAGTGDEIADLRKWKASSNAAPEVAKVRKHKPDAEVHKRGEEIYAKTCIACHQPGGVGQEGIFPPLDGSDWLTAEGSLEAKIVLKGLQGKVTVNGKDYTNVMPPHIDLNDQQIADVLTFVRQTGKNDLPAVAPDLVKKIREATKDRVQPWTAQELGK